MAFLNSSERHTLSLLCESLLPALEPEPGDNPELFAFHASAIDLAATLETAMEQVSSPGELVQFRFFLKAIEIGLFNQMTTGLNGGVSALTPQAREVFLRAWSESQYVLARKTFQAIKRLAMFLGYSYMPDGQPNPSWKAFNYAIPPRPANPPPKTIRPLTIHADTVLDADVLVIGSGAGGGVVAGELAASGLDVIVAEKGDYFSEADFHGQELESMNQMYERQGAMTSTDLSVLILAGSTLGGGTTINWTACLRTPQSILEEWEHQYGFTGVTSAAFARSMEAVMARSNVSPEESTTSPQTCAMTDGCDALGFDVGVIPRNVNGCGDCGFCNFGCPTGAKQGTLKTYLQDAHDQGTRIIVRAHVDKVLVERGAAVGALLTVRDREGRAYKVRVKSKAVVCAAGSLHTPAILLRSGLGNPNIGAHLHLHPTTSVYGLFKHAIRGWEGAPLTRLARDFTDLDGKGYGVRLETAPLHPGIAALAVPWESGRQHRRVMQRLEQMAGMIIITRDRDSGRVRVDRSGRPVIDYRVSDYDAQHLLRGTVEALRVHHAIGAEEVSSPHTPPMVYRRQGQFESYLDSVMARGVQPNAFAVFSAHQMSSCRIGGNSAIGAVKPNGETYEVRDLFVADGSVLPTASGVNPMLSIMGTAHYLAQHIKHHVER